MPAGKGQEKQQLMFQLISLSGLAIKSGTFYGHLLVI